MRVVVVVDVCVGITGGSQAHNFTTECVAVNGSRGNWEEEKVSFPPPSPRSLQPANSESRRQLLDAIHFQLRRRRLDTEFQATDLTFHNTPGT